MSEDLGAIYWRVEADTSGLRKAELAMDDVGTKAQQSGAKVDQFGKETEEAGKKAEKGMSGASNAAKTLYTAIGAIAASQAVREVVRYADAWQNATNQLKTVQKETESLAATQDMLLAISNETRAGFETTSNLYTRLSRSTESLNLTQAELIGLTKTINQSFAVSGASATEASNAIIQLSQGLSAGALRGEEFNSVSEQSPILMQAIADSLQMTRGELRAFAADGGITAEIVVKALQEASTGIDATFNKMSATFEQNMTVAKNNMLEFVGASDTVQAVTGSMGSVLVGLSENLGAVGIAAEAVAVVFGGKMIAGLAASTVETVKKTAATFAATQAEVAKTAAAAAAAKADLAAAQAAAARTPGFYLNAQAMAALTAAERASTAATAAHTTAMGAATTAASVLRGAMTLLGGPAGIAIIAAYGVYKLADSFTSASKEANLLGDALGDLSSPLDQTMARVNQLIGAQLDLVDVTVLANMSVTNSAEVLERLDSLYGESARIRQRHNQIVGDQNELGNLLNQAIQKQSESLAGNTQATSESSAAASVHRMRTEEELQALRKSSVELDHGTFSTKAKTDAVEDLINSLSVVRMSYSDFIPILSQTEWRMQGVTDATYDNSDAIKFWTAVSEDGAERRQRAEDDAAESIQRNWERTHEYITTSLIDIADNGGDAFGKIEDSFKTMVKRMIAEWAASGLMKLFGIGGGSLSVGGAGTGSSVAGSAASGAVSGIVGSVASAIAAGYKGGGIVGAIAGTGQAGTGLVGGLAGIPGWGWALGGAAILAKTLEKDPTFSANAGMLIHDAPGASADRKFDVKAFESGFKPVGFARREDQSTAKEIIDVFREYDTALTKIAKEAGLAVDFSNNPFGGYDEKGQGNGLFLGFAAEDGKETGVTMAEQLDSFVRQWFKALGGQISQADLDDVMSFGTADEMVKRAAEIVAAQLEQQKKTEDLQVKVDDAMTAREKAVRSAAESVMKAYEGGLSDEDAIKLAYERFKQLEGRGLTIADLEKVSGTPGSAIKDIFDAYESTIQKEEKQKEAILPPQEAATKRAAESVMNALNSGLSTQDSVKSAYETFKRNEERGLTLEQVEKYTSLSAESLRGVFSAYEASIAKPIAPGTAAAEVSTRNAAMSVMDAINSGLSIQDSIAQAYDRFKKLEERGLTLAQVEQYTQLPANWLAQAFAEYERSIAPKVATASTDPYAGLPILGSGGKVHGSHATGLNRVPFNGYIAELHEGERVKTRSEANAEDAQGTLMQSMYQMLMRNSQVMTAIIQRWDLDGLPGTRAVDLTP